MCHFISWVEADEEVYFITDKQLKTKKAKKLLSDGYRLDDITGHGFIRDYYDLPSYAVDDYMYIKDASKCYGINRENIRFISDVDKFPKKIQKALKNFNKNFNYIISYPSHNDVLDRLLAKPGCYNEIEFLLKNKIDINNSYYIADMYGTLDIKYLKLLLNYGADINKTDTCEATVTENALDHNQLGRVKFAISQGGKIPKLFLKICFVDIKYSLYYVLWFICKIEKFGKSIPQLFKKLYNFILGRKL
jgi:hypothetical protein